MSFEGSKSAVPLAVQGGCLAGLLFFVMLADSIFAFSHHIEFIEVMLLLGVLVTVPQLREVSHRWKAIGLLPIFTLAVVSLRFVSLSPVKSYRQFYDAVNNGMTPEQVNALYYRYFPKNGQFRQPFFKASNLSPQYNYPNTTEPPNKMFHYNLDLTDGRYNAETISIYFKGGKVVGKEYSPD